MVLRRRIRQPGNTNTLGRFPPDVRGFAAMAVIGFSGPQRGQ